MNRDILFSRLRGQFPGDNTGFNPFDLIHKFGSPLIALLYSELFWPEFVELEGMVFLASDVEDEADRARIRDVLTRCAGDKQKVEMSFNCIEVPSLFGPRAEESSDSEDRLLAERIAASWRARLSEQFPDRSFCVTIVEPNSSTDEIAVLFYDTRIE